MLRTLEDLHGYAIGAVDGAIGTVEDLYLDDQAWVVRYLVVETGGWLRGRKVLISPIAIGHADRATRQLPVRITMDQVRNSPDIDTDKPVTRQHEVVYSDYYDYPFYWGGMGYWGSGMVPDMILPGYGGFGSPQAIREQMLVDRTPAETARSDRADHADHHLRSCRALTGYHLHASDGELGHVSGMLIDDETWAVRYLVVETGHWWFGHRVLVAPQWVEDVSWAEGTVSVELTRQVVKEAPAYDSDESLIRAGEARLHEHYGRPGYWTDARHGKTEASQV